MADTAYGVNHPLAVKLWSKRLMREALKETFVYRFMGKSTNSLLYVKDDLHKQAGDRIRVGLRMQLTGAGIKGDSTLEGNEEALVTYSDDILIDQQRWAVKSDGEMSEQRVPFSVREEAFDGLRDWWAAKLDTAFFNAISGNTAATADDNGNNTLTAPSSTADNTRIMYGDGGQATENSLSATATASNVFRLTFLDRAIAQAKTATPLIRPLRIDGQEKFVCFLHPYQVYDLRTDATANRVIWYDIMRARIQGGEMDKNGIFSGALGEYNGVVLHESTRVPLAPTTTTVRRAIFCGAQAACFATGQRDTANEMKWVEETKDYKNKLGVSAGLIYGLKKMVYNSIDFATIVISTFAKAP